MRPLAVAGSCFSLILFVMFGPCAYTEPGAQKNISFSLSFDPGSHTRLALADKLKPGLDVVLVGKKICTARTGTTFTHSDGAYEFQATYLLGLGKCNSENVNVAVMGVEATAIGVISPQESRAPVSKDIESKARRRLLAREAARARDDSWGPLSHNPPKTFRLKEGMLLQFKWKDWEGGPSVWIIKDSIFLLPGVCTSGYRFFSVQGRPHLGYDAWSCCACDVYAFIVYDLSGSKPKELYVNCEFGG